MIKKWEYIRRMRTSTRLSRSRKNQLKMYQENEKKNVRRKIINKEVIVYVL